MPSSALLFPGQGSHAEGMEEPYRGNPLFERGLELLGHDPFERLAEGTRFQQPALFLCSVAAWDAWLTDAPEEILAAELIREAALDGVRDELPHSIAVVVEEMSLREDRPEDKPLLDISANLYVERSSQKGIVIGRKGERLRRVGTAARQQIEALLGTPVYLDLHVKIAKDWQRDPKQLRKLGF